MAPLVLVLGPPGSGKSTQCAKLAPALGGWVILNTSEIVRQQASASTKSAAVSP